MNEHILSALKQVALFSGLPEGLIAVLAGKVKEETLLPGEILFHEGDKGDSIYFIQSGSLEVYRENETEEKVVLATLGQGEYFGEMAILDNKPRNASVQALTDSHLLNLCQDDFFAILDGDPELRQNLEEAIAARRRLSQETSAPAIEPEEPLGASKTRVFVSYSRKDKAFVQKLHEAISAHSVDTWVDWENIPMTVDWWEEIKRGIEGADAFAFVISPDSVASPICNDEIQTAVDINKRMVPILYRDTVPGPPMHTKISAHNWVLMRTDEEFQANLSEMLRIINTDLEWVQTHTRLLQRAVEWDRESRNNSFLLRGDDLARAEEWLVRATGKETQPTLLQADFIQASREEETRRQAQQAALERRSRNFLRALVGVFAVAAVIAIFLSIFAFNQREDAISQRAIAEAASTQAIANEEKALQQEATAEARRVEAEDARATAVAERDRAATAQANAEISQKNAEEQAFIARIGEVSAWALTQLDEQLDLALLLSVEAFQLHDSFQTRNSLYSAWRQNYLLAAFLQGHDLGINSLAWSPDGSILASGGCGNVEGHCTRGLIQLWDPQTGKLLKSLEGHSDDIISLSWSPDGRLASVAWMDDTVIIWDIETGQPDSTLRAPELGVKNIAWSPDGKFLAAGFESGLIRVWDPATGSTYQTLEPPQGEVGSVVAWSSEGLLASGSWYGSVVVWDLAKEGQVRVLESDHGQVLSVAWSPDGRLASGHIDYTVLVWDPPASPGEFIPEEQPARELDGHSNWVKSVAWSKDGQLASSSEDSTIIIWDLDREKPNLILRGHQRVVPTVTWSPDGRMASASADNKVILWDLGKDPSGGSRLGDENGPQAVSVPWLEEEDFIWSLDGRMAASARGSIINVWEVPVTFRSDPGKDQSAYTLISPLGDVIQLAWSPAGRLASVGLDGTVILWDLESQQASQTLQLPEGENQYFAWPEDNYLVFVSVDRKVQVIDLAKGQVSTLALDEPEAGKFEAWSPSGKLATVLEDYSVMVWDILGAHRANRDRVQPLLLPKVHTDTVSIRDRNKGFSLAWSPMGLLASGSCKAVDEDLKCVEGSIAIWDLSVWPGDVQNGDPPVQLLDGVGGQVTSLAWRPDGAVLASGGCGKKGEFCTEGEVRLWDPGGGTIIPSLKVHEGEVIDLSWQPDGRLASSSYYSDIILLVVDPAEWAHQNCQRAGRNLTEAEWNQYLSWRGPFDTKYRTCPQWPPGG